MRISGSAGDGPVCPIVQEHGRLYSWEDGRYYCPSNSHGGNGRFFTDKQALGEIEITEDDVSDMLKAAAERVIAGSMSLDQATASVSRSSKRASATVRESLTIMIDTIKHEGEDMAQRRAAAKTQKAAAAPKATGHRMEQVPGAKFQELADKYGYTPAQVRDACAAAGMGKSTTYVYILLHTGASSKLFARFEEALANYVPPAAEEDAADSEE